MELPKILSTAGPDQSRAVSGAGFDPQHLQVFTNKWGLRAKDENTIVVARHLPPDTARGASPLRGTFVGTQGLDGPLHQLFGRENTGAGFHETVLPPWGLYYFEPQAQQEPANFSPLLFSDREHSRSDRRNSTEEVALLAIRYGGINSVAAAVALSKQLRGALGSLGRNNFIRQFNRAHWELTNLFPLPAGMLAGVLEGWGQRPVLTYAPAALQRLVEEEEISEGIVPHERARPEVENFVPVGK